jgi:hypothetical protein
MAKRNRKPFDPAADEAKRAKHRQTEDAQMRAEGVDPKIARWGDQPLDGQRVAALERQGYAVVRADSDTAKNPGRSTVAVDHNGRQVKASHKADVWQQLFTRGTLSQSQLNAVRDLQDLMAKRAGLGGRDEDKAYSSTRVEAPSRDPCLVSDTMLTAGIEMDLTLALVGPPSSRLLTALLWPDVLAEPHDWRDIVARVTGVTYALSQSVPLLIAAQALLDVRPQVQKAMGERKNAQGRAGTSKRERADPQALHPFHCEPVLA